MFDFARGGKEEGRSRLWSNPRLHGFELVVHRFFVSARLCIASALQAEAGVAHGASVPARAGWQLCAALHIAINSMETKCCNQGAQAVLAREVADNLDAA